MKLSKTQKILLSASTLALACSAQLAQGAEEDAGWYAGIGAARLDADFEDTADLSFDDSDTSAQVKVGYMFNDIWGVEGGYMDLGDYDIDGGVRIDADAFWIAALGNWSVSEMWDLYGKLGFTFLDAASDQTVPFVGTFEENDTESNVFGAVGAEIDFGNWGIYGEFSVMDTDVNDLNIDIVALGVTFEF